jgi:hypothetical protein
MRRFGISRSPLFPISTSTLPRERAWIAELLSELGPAARKAIPALLRAAGDPEQEVSSAARNALKILTPAKPSPAGGNP